MAEKHSKVGKKHDKASKHAAKTSNNPSIADSKITNNEYSKTNVMAILSLIFGIVFFIPFAPILAIIFGFVSLSQIKNTQEEGKGMAIAGIILGFFWIVLLIFIIIFFLIFLSTILLAVMPYALASNITAP